MTYYESAECETITQARAARECAKHGAAVEDMIADLGDRAEYDAQEVLRWLGY